MGRARGHITLKDDAHLIPLENGAEFACLGEWTGFLPSLLARKPLKLATVRFTPIAIDRGSWHLYWDF